jgi:protease-4
VTARTFATRALTLVGALTVSLIALSLVFSLGKPAWLQPDRVGVLHLDGEITSDEAFLGDLDFLRGDPSVKAIVVRLDSPGGAVAPSQSIYQELKALREAGVPVVASLQSVGASGGYYVALAADTILALPGSITGSIGVLMEFPNTQPLMEKLGVSMEVVKSAEHKDIGSPFRAATEGDRAVLQAMIADVYDQFVDVVQEARGLTDTRVRELADGRIFSGRQAAADGLIDREGNLTDAIAVAGRMAGLGDEPETVSPPAPRASLLDVLLGAGASSLAERLHAGAATLQGPRLRYVAH